MRTKKLFFTLPFLCFLTACATPRVAVNPRADFSAVKRGAVMPFSGPKGDLAADILTQSLIAQGADVIERRRFDDVIKEHSLSSSGAFDPATAEELGRLLGVDALFLGTVAESTPPGAYLVSASENPHMTSVTQVSNTNIYSEGSVMGIPNSQLLSTTANVSLVSRMVDVQTGSIMWSASMTYEGFDISSAMAGITDAFIRSLAPIWPGLGRAAKE